MPSRGPFSQQVGRVHLRIDPSLRAWLDDYVARRSVKENRRVTLSSIVTEHLVTLRQKDAQETSGDAEPA